MFYVCSRGLDNLNYHSVRVRRCSRCQNLYYTKGKSSAICPECRKKRGTVCRDEIILTMGNDEQRCRFWIGDKEGQCKSKATRGNYCEEHNIKTFKEETPLIKL